MKKLILAVCALLAFMPISNAQTQAELKAARALARQQGYSETEIDQALNKASNGDVNTEPNAAAQNVNPVVNPGTGTVVTPPVSDVTMPVAQIPEPAFVSPIAGRQAPSSTIYGHDFFISDGLSLIPSINAPVPESYVLGPGDNMVIDLWGSATATYSCIVSNEGSISVKGVSPIYVGGQTLKEARKLIKSKMSAKFSGLSNGSTGINVTLSKIRGVAVYVVGDVYCPGVYTLPSLSSVTTAIYMAGGIMKYGSVRQINIYRGNSLAGTFDLYDYIFKGKYDTNVLLQDGDVISVCSMGNIVSVGGALNRDGLQYEIKDDETVSDLIRYAGGFKTNAHRGMVHIDRFDGTRGLTYDVKSEDFDSFKLMAGDSVSVSSNIVMYENRIVITGSINHPGSYALSDNLRTLRQLIEAAGGLKEGTYMKNGYICRKDAELNPTSVAFSLERIMNGKDNIDLVREDSVCIFTVGELRDSLTVTIKGELNAPGDFDWRENITIGDLILMAEGTNDGADLTNVEVASMSRGNGPSLKKYNLVTSPESYGVTLAPFDVVIVRKIIGYRPMTTVTVTGEVKYPGVYAIDKKDFRLSDLIERVQGFTDDAYIKGASLKRLMTEDEMEKAKMGLIIMEKKKLDQKKLLDETLLNSDQDSIVIDMTELDDTYLVGIDLEAAVKHPGSYRDIVLRSGDVLDIPLINNTVKISGAVNFPNTVAYNSSFSWRDYVHQAGGFKKTARKKIYAVYMDGSAAVRGSRKFKMAPGMEIIVPEIEESANKLSLAEIASLTSSVSSMAYMAALLVNMLKK